MEELFTVKQAAQILKCSGNTIRRLARKYKIAQPMGSDSKRGVYMLTKEQIARISDKIAPYRTERIVRE